MVIQFWGFLFLVVTLIHSCETFGVIFIVVVGYVAILDRITQVVKKIKIGILVVSVGKRIHAVNNACQDGERGKVTSFDAV